MSDMGPQREHTKNKTPSNRGKHEKGQAAKVKQKETAQMQKNKQKDSKSSKYQQRTSGSASRSGKKKK